MQIPILLDQTEIATISTALAKMAVSRDCSFEMLQCSYKISKKIMEIVQRK